MTQADKLRAVRALCHAVIVAGEADEESAYLKCADECGIGFLTGGSFVEGWKGAAKFFALSRNVTPALAKGMLLALDAIETWSTGPDLLPITRDSASTKLNELLSTFTDTELAPYLT